MLKEKMTRTLIKEKSNFPEGYGILWTPEELKIIQEFDEIEYYWESDETLPKYCVGKKNPGLYNIPYKEITCGQLKVYGIKYD